MENSIHFFFETSPNHWPGPTSTVELNLEATKRKSITVGVGAVKLCHYHYSHLYWVSVTPAGL